MDDGTRSGDVRDSGFFGTEGGEGAEALDPAVVGLLDELVAGAPAGRDGLIGVLLGLQRAFDRVSWRLQELVADRYGLSPAQVAGLVSYYPALSRERRSRITVEVCSGTACWLRGSAAVWRELEIEAGRRGRVVDRPALSVGHQRCMGICGLSPAVRCLDRVRSSVTAGEVSKMVTELVGGESHGEVDE
jgi:NADH:ubiquinone oxidoreductase subunit E